MIIFVPSNDILSPAAFPNNVCPLPLIQTPVPLVWLVGGVEPNANAPPFSLINLTVPVESFYSIYSTC